MSKAVPTISPTGKKLSRIVRGRKILSPVDQKLSPGQNSTDAKLVALFDDWILDQSHEIEKEIIATPATGAAGAYVKSHLVWYSRLNCGPDDITLRCPELFEEDPDPGDPDEYEWMRGAIVVSHFRDAARHVPKIAELAAPIIHDDAILIDADLEIQQCRRGSQTPEDDATILRMLARIAKPEAKTPRGEAIKAKYAVAVDLFAAD